MTKTTHHIDGFRVVVSEGFSASVYKGRKLLNHYVISAPTYLLSLGLANDEYVANAAAQAVKESA